MTTIFRHLDFFKKIKNPTKVTTFAFYQRFPFSLLGIIWNGTVMSQWWSNTIQLCAGDKTSWEQSNRGGSDWLFPNTPPVGRPEPPNQRLHRASLRLQRRSCRGTPQPSAAIPARSPWQPGSPTRKLKGGEETHHPNEDRGSSSQKSSAFVSTVDWVHVNCSPICLPLKSDFFCKIRMLFFPCGLCMSGFPPTFQRHAGQVDWAP